MSMKYLGGKFKKRIMRKKGNQGGKAILEGEEQKRDRVAGDGQRSRRT